MQSRIFVLPVMKLTAFDNNWLFINCLNICQLPKWSQIQPTETILIAISGTSSYLKCDNGKDIAYTDIAR
jgi:hypothetical protein